MIIPRTRFAPWRPLCAVLVLSVVVSAPADGPKPGKNDDPKGKTAGRGDKRAKKGDKNAKDGDGKKKTDKPDRPSNIARLKLDRPEQQAVADAAIELMTGRPEITEEEEVFLFDVVNEILVGREGCVALEFRTDRDKSQPKETDTHFRRYVSPVHFFARARENGFEVEYFVEGFGFAKYKQDDAHVARFLLNKVS